MEFYYEVLKAHITPEALGQLNEHKIIFESASQQKLKGRYSIVAFDYYGTVKLNDNELIIKTLKEDKVITTEPYNYLKTFINQFDCVINDEKLKQLPFISGFMGTCSFDLVRHEFPILKRVAIKSMKTISDVSFYMIEDVFVFDHYKDELYVIASNQFSKASNAELKLRVKHRIQALSQIKVYQENNKMVPKRSGIKANISDKQFIDIVTQMKQRITEGDMFQVVPSRIYSYQHHFGENKTN